MKRIRTLLVLIAAVALLSGCLNSSQQKALDLLNNDRRTNSVRALSVHDPAQAKAQDWADHLASTGLLVHSVLQAGYASGSWCSLGENIGKGSTLADVENQYMKSPDHRANILDTKWNGVGVGVARSRDGTLYVVQEFIRTC